MEVFFLVWSPQGMYPPKFRHPTRESATTEAERLARLHPNSQFFVLEAISESYENRPLTIDLYKHNDDIPF
jgi:hypothetical protein